MKKILLSCLLLFFYNIAYAMEQKKLFFAICPSPLSGQVIIKELTEENVQSDEIARRTLARLQQHAQVGRPYFAFDAFDVYAIISRKVKPSDSQKQQEQLKEVQKNIEDYIFLHHYASNTERQTALDREQARRNLVFFTKNMDELWKIR